jgi:hypothetical protein
MEISQPVERVWQCHQRIIDELALNLKQDMVEGDRKISKLIEADEQKAAILKEGNARRP